MKRSIPTGYMGVLTALLPVFFACTAVRAAAEADTRRVRQTVHGDSLVLRAEGRLPVYECNGRIYLELPREGVEVTAQIDRGQGIRNRALPVDSTLSCFTEPDKMRTIHAGTSDRPLVDITDPLLSVDGWANPAGEVGTPDTGRNELLGVEPFGEGVLFRLRNRYKYTNGETMVTMALPSGVQPVEFSVALTLRGKVRPRILIAGSTLPETYARLLNLAVKRYNRAHRKLSLIHI